jgi:MATE family multidrug resistance protein
VHVGTEWWAFEIVALAAGRLGTVSLAAQSVRTAEICAARAAPVSSRFPSRLPTRPDVATPIPKLIGTRDQFAKIFNDDSSVVSLTAEVLPYVALFQIADAPNRETQARFPMAMRHSNNSPN